MPALENMMIDIKRELQTIREDMRNVLRAANMASEESQKVAMRMDNLEYEWLLWNDGQHNGIADPEQQRAEEGGQPPPPDALHLLFVPSPRCTPMVHRHRFAHPIDFCARC